MAYKVKQRFKDLEEGKIYEVGDKISASLSKDRENVLTTKDNKYKTVFLEKVETKKKSSKK